MAEAPDKGRLWLFTNTFKKTDKHPAFTGSGEISIDVLKQLVSAVKENPPKDGILKLSCAAWEKVSKANAQYLFVTFELKEERESNTSKSRDEDKGHSDGWEDPAGKGTDDLPDDPFG